MNWRDLAKCRDMDPQIFFPDEGVGIRADWETPRAVCAVCQVREACLDAAMREEQCLSRDARAGVRGAMTPKERYKYARRMRRAV